MRSSWSLHSYRHVNAKRESGAMGRAAVAEVSNEIPGNRQFIHRHAHTHAETTCFAPTGDAEIVDAAGNTAVSNSSLFTQIVRGGTITSAA